MKKLLLFTLLVLMVGSMVFGEEVRDLKYPESEGLDEKIKFWEEYIDKHNKREDTNIKYTNFHRLGVNSEDIHWHFYVQFNDYVLQDEIESFLSANNIIIFKMIKKDYTKKDLTFGTEEKRFYYIYWLNVQTNSEKDIREYYELLKKEKGEDKKISYLNLNPLLEFTEGQRGQSEISLFAFYESGARYNDFPLFVHGKVAADYPADPPDSTIDIFNADVDLSTLGIDPNVVVSMLEPYSSIQDNVSNNESAQIDSISGVAVDINDSQLLRRLRTNDRFYVADTYQFSATDTIVAIAVP